MSENILESGKLYELWAWYESNRKKIHTWAIILTIIGVSIAYVIWSGNQKKINANTALFELGEPISIIAKGEVPAADLLKIAENYSGTSTAERAILEAGAVYFTTGEYQKAYDTFKNFQNSFPTAGPLLSIASYGEAVSLDAMNKVDEAIALYQKLITDNTLVSLQSKINLASLYLAKEQPDYKDRKKEIHQEIEEEARALLVQMGLGDRMSNYPHQLSGGQCQRVAIARALALKPDILCFDEPTSALDPELTGEVLKVIKELADKKTTMIIVTHEMAFAHDVASKVIFMDEGMILEQGTPEEVFEHTRQERTKQFLSRYTKNEQFG